jgi:hypothetical protein
MAIILVSCMIETSMEYDEENARLPRFRNGSLQEEVKESLTRVLRGSKYVQEVLRIDLGDMDGSSRDQGDQAIPTVIEDTGSNKRRAG